MTQILALLNHPCKSVGKSQCSSVRWFRDLSPDPHFDMKIVDLPMIFGKKTLNSFVKIKILHEKIVSIIEKQYLCNRIKFSLFRIGVSPVGKGLQ